MKGAMHYALLALGLTLSVPAAAQTEIRFQTGPAGRKVLAEFAQCVVERHPDVAHQLLQDLQEISGEANREGVRQLVDYRCLPSAASHSLKASADVYWPALAEALLARHKMLDNAVALDSVPPLAHPPVSAGKADEAASSSEQRRAEEGALSSLRHAMMSRIGECTVRRDSEKARLLLKTAIVSDEEAAAGQALVPTIGTCFTGGDLRLNLEMIRAMVAINYFRLTAAQLAQQQAGGFQ